MSTFFMFGKYSSESIKKISKERTQQVLNIIKEFKGEVVSMYALMGGYDLVLIIKFPDISEATKSSVEMTKLTGIFFSTLPAFSIEEFDKLVENK
jgi:uncharacterized protein with GYD domain